MNRFGLTIAGSDSSAGAGIQADCRAFAQLGIPCATAVTAVTSQGVGGVDGVQLVDPELIANQIANAFEMYEIGAVKVGMLGGEAQVEAIGRALRSQERPFLVLDPVLRSTSGTELLTQQGVRRMLDDLLPLATLFTPNVDELAALTGMPVSSREERASAARSLFPFGAKAILVKGGHLEGHPEDLLVQPERDDVVFWGERVETEHSRGTGCNLSSLIAGHLLLGAPMLEAIRVSKWRLQAALNFSVVPRVGRGYPVPSDRAIHDERLARIRGVYFVTDAQLNPKLPHTTGARLAIDGGAKVAQLREKRFSVGDLVSTAKRIREIAAKRGAVFIVNDRVDVALAAEADGVHLGPDDMSPGDALKLLGPSRIIGVSVGTLKEAKKLAPVASYLAVGAIFGSSTKSDAGEAVGLERLREIRKAFPDHKIVAIGGINLSNIASVAEAGADAAAVISAIVCAEDPKQATRELVAEFERGLARRTAGDQR